MRHRDQAGKRKKQADFLIEPASGNSVELGCDARLAQMRVSQTDQQESTNPVWVDFGRMGGGKTHLAEA